MRRTTSPLTSICRVLGFPRRTLSYQAQPRDDQEVCQAIAAVAPPCPPDGSRRMAAQVRRAPDRPLGKRQRAQCVMRPMGLWRPTRPRTQRTPNRPQGFRRCPQLVANRLARAPDEIWVCDLTDVRLGAECIDVARMMAGLTRDMHGWPLGRTLAQALTLTALQWALAHHTPVMHQSDPGMQDAAPQSSQTLPAAGSQSSRAAVGEPRHNGHAERVIRTIKEEEIDLAESYNVAEALTQIGQVIDDVDRTKRMHSALGSLTPVECEAAWRRAHQA